MKSAPHTCPMTATSPTTVRFQRMPDQADISSLKCTRVSMLQPATRPPIKHYRHSSGTSTTGAENSSYVETETDSSSSNRQLIVRGVTKGMPLSAIPSAGCDGFVSEPSQESRLPGILKTDRGTARSRSGSLNSMDEEEEENIRGTSIGSSPLMEVAKSSFSPPACFVNSLVDFRKPSRAKLQPVRSVHTGFRRPRSTRSESCRTVTPAMERKRVRFGSDSEEDGSVVVQVREYELETLSSGSSKDVMSRMKGAPMTRRHRGLSSHSLRPKGATRQPRTSLTEPSTPVSADDSDEDRDRFASLAPLPQQVRPHIATLASLIRGRPAPGDRVQPQKQHFAGEVFYTEEPQDVVSPPPQQPPPNDTNSSSFSSVSLPIQPVAEIDPRYCSPSKQTARWPGVPGVRWPANETALRRMAGSTLVHQRLPTRRVHLEEAPPLEPALSPQTSRYALGSREYGEEQIYVPTELATNRYSPARFVLGTDSTTSDPAPDRQIFIRHTPEASSYGFYVSPDYNNELTPPRTYLAPNRRRPPPMPQQIIVSKRAVPEVVDYGTSLYMPAEVQQEAAETPYFLYTSDEPSVPEDVYEPTAPDLQLMRKATTLNPPAAVRRNTSTIVSPPYEGGGGSNFARSRQRTRVVQHQPRLTQRQVAQLSYVDWHLAGPAGGGRQRMYNGDIPQQYAMQQQKRSSENARSSGVYFSTGHHFGFMQQPDTSPGLGI